VSDQIKDELDAVKVEVQKSTAGYRNSLMRKTPRWHKFP